MTALFAGLFGLILCAGPAFSGSDHLAEALRHAQAALENCEKSDTRRTAEEHAKDAKLHTEAAMKAAIDEKTKEYLTAAFRSLDSAIRHAEVNRMEAACVSLKEAVTHLKAAT
jgi:hypothetical protein